MESSLLPIYMLFKPFLIKDGKPPNNYLGKITSFSSRARKIHIGKISKNMKFYQILGPFKELFEQLSKYETENKENLQDDMKEDKDDKDSNGFPESFNLFVKIIQILNSNIFIYISQYIDKITVIIAVMDYSNLFINDAYKSKKISYYPSINEIISRRPVNNDEESVIITSKIHQNKTGYTIDEFKELYQTTSVPERVRSYFLGPYPPSNIKEYKLDKIKNYQEKIINDGNMVITDINPILESIKKWILNSINILPNFTYTPIYQKNKTDDTSKDISFAEYKSKNNREINNSESRNSESRNNESRNNESRSCFAKKLNQQKQDTNKNNNNNNMDSDDDGFIKITKKNKF